jgi:ABC-type microcin C transport system permease subunit YejE
MMLVEHAGDAVEAEAVELKFIEPIAAIREQKVQDLVFSIIEESRIPGHMVATGPLVKVLVGGTVKSAETLDFVGYGMRVDQVHKDS